MSSKVDPATIAAYAATHYVVHGAVPDFVLRSGRRSAELKALYDRNGVACAAFVTAWNPGSHRRDDAINQAAQSQLEQALRETTFPIFAGIATDPNGAWPNEPSVLVLGIKREDAEQLGRQYG